MFETEPATVDRTPIHHGHFGDIGGVCRVYLLDF